MIFHNQPEYLLCSMIGESCIVPHPVLSQRNSSVFVKPYTPTTNGPSYKQPETLFTSLKLVFQGKDQLRFFDHRFIGIWVLPFAATGIFMEILFVAPLNNTVPFG